MDRRRFRLTSLAGALAAPLVAGAKETRKIARIGYLTPVTSRNPVEEAFERSLEELGWIRDRNIRIESRYSGGRQDTVAALAEELVGPKLDVIVAWGPASLEVKRATAQIPVVFLSMFADPLDLGLVSNLARPGSNVTGVAISGPGMDAKRLQLLREAVPSLRRITMLVSSEVKQTFTGERTRVLTAAIKGLNLEVRETDVAAPSELETAVREATKRGAQALYVPPSGLAFAYGKDISDFALANRLPSIHAFRESVADGGLLSYAPSVTDVARRGAVYVDKILKGAKPGELPVEQPTRFELVINLKTAKALGLTIPPSVLARADQVIE